MLSVTDDTSTHAINPLEHAGWWSQLTFAWVRPMLRLGNTKKLGAPDLPQTCTADSAASLGGRLSEAWDAELAWCDVKHTNRRRFACCCQRDNSIMWAAMWRAFGPEYLWYGLLQMSEEVLRVIQTAFLAALLVELQRERKAGEVSSTWGYLSCLGLVLTGLGHGVMHHIYFWRAWRMGLQTRVACQQLIFHRAIDLPLSTLTDLTTGHLINLASNDIERLNVACLFGPSLVISPVILVVVLVLLWHLVGVASLAGAGTCLLLAVVQTNISKRFGGLRRRAAKHQDKRFELTQQMIAGIELVKQMTWEQSFVDAIDRERAKELNILTTATLLRAANFIFMGGSSLIVSFAVFYAFHTTGAVLRPSVVFPTMALFNVLRITIFHFNHSIEGIAELNVTFKRMQALMLLPRHSERANTPSPSTAAVISAQDVDVVEKDAESKRPGGEVVLRAAALRCRWSTRSSEASTESKANDKAAVVPVDGDDSKKVTTKRPPEDTFVLGPVSLDLAKGSLIAVSGAVGSGKSSLLLALLREMNIDDGELSCDVPLVFAAQESFIVSGTVQENILFTAELDAKIYGDVLDSCCLRPDLDSMPAGDQTVIGERGVTISGGQKARIGLARCAYAAVLAGRSGSGVVALLDDPLSAVDPAVAEELFSGLIHGLLLKAGASVILVTHQTQFCARCDRVLVLKRGRVAGFGKWDQDLAAAAGAVVSSPGATEKERAKKEVSQAHAAAQPPPAATDVATVPRSPPEKAADEKKKAATTTGLVKAEESASGSLSLSVFWAYLSAAFGPGLAAFIVALCIFSELFVVAADWWLSRWADADSSAHPESTPAAVAAAAAAAAAAGLAATNASNSTATTTGVGVAQAVVDPETTTTTTTTGMFGVSFVLGYLLLFSCALPVLTGRTVLFMLSMVQSAKNLHSRLLRRIVRAPMAWFHERPLGRTLNRFSKDFGVIDDILPKTLMDFTACLFTTINCFVLVCAIVPLALLPLIPLLLRFIWMRRYYLEASREIKRLESTTRSPIYSLLTEVLRGLTTVRAFGRGSVERFRTIFRNRVDRNTSSYFWFLATARWLGFHLDVLVIFFLAFASFGALVTNDYLDLGISPGLVGLALLYNMRLTALFQWCVRQSAEVENHFVAVERILAFTKAPQEPPLLRSSRRERGAADLLAELAPDHAARVESGAWPEKGEIKLSACSMRYREGLDLALKQVDLFFPAGQKIAVVGRTGAGKSSLIQVLFRLVEATAPGAVTIDGVPTAALGLHELRRAISIIPQVPHVFSGTIRTNLDPFDEHTDAELWQALKTAQMDKKVRRMSERGEAEAEAVGKDGEEALREKEKDGDEDVAGLGLDAPVAEGGANLSMGEAQLICLARALLSPARILCLDEATAHVDKTTDAVIQDAVDRLRFQEKRTTIVIAHRLGTIIDADKVCVLADGKVVEVGRPHELLQSPAAGKMSFAAMVDETGEEMASHLRRKAREAHEKLAGRRS